MNKEILARWITILLVAMAAAIPLGGWLQSRNSPGVTELRGRMPENGGWSVETINAQAGQPITLHMTSDDVVHGIAIARSEQPAVDIFPGEFTDLTLTFDQPGKYTFYCSRWCGPSHWRMRGTIEVAGAGAPLPPDLQPQFLKSGIDIDAPKMANVTPALPTSAERGSTLANRLPAYTFARETYLVSSPSEVWTRLRADLELASLSDMDLWDTVTWIWLNQTTSDALSAGKKLYATNCAACHGESGKGDGVMVRGLPVWNPGQVKSGEASRQQTGEGLFSPPDFSDPRVLLGASPALLEGKIIRGGMGTGMPYWGPIFTREQIEGLVNYLYSFAWQTYSVK